MKRTILAVFVIGVLAGCGLLGKGSLTHVGTLQQQLETEVAALPANRAAVQPRLAQLARDARTAAQRDADPQNTVAFYRIAALAAWQAGPAIPADEVTAIAAAGNAACTALPATQPRPTDCAIIRLAKPFAVADAYRSRLVALADQLTRLDQAQAQRCATLAGQPKQDCVAEVVTLPAADRQEILQVFAGFEAALKDTRDVAHSMGNVGAGLTEAATNGQAIIYCNAEKTWLIAKRVDGMRPDRELLTCRRKRLDCLLTRPDAACADPCPSDVENPLVDCPAFGAQALALPVN